MNFDFGEILSSAFQVTWRRKILWVFSALPILLSFLIFPLMFVPIFFMDNGSFNDPFFVNEPVYVVLFVAFSIFISLVSYGLYGVSSSAVILGAVRADGDNEAGEQFTFNELFNGSKPYWWRVLGVLLLVGLGISLVFMVIFGCMSLIGMVTVGLGFICLFPLMLLMYPAMMVLYGFIEISQVGVVADDLGVTDAIQRGWELVRANLWRIVLISLVVYFGVGLLSGIVMFPFMIPFFFLQAFMESQSNFEPRTMMLFMGGFGLIFFPIMALVQGVGITFMKSAYTLVYLRLTKPQDDAPAPVLETSE